MLNFILFVFCASGIYGIFTSQLALQSPAVVKAIRLRGEGKQSILEVWTGKLSLRIVPLINLDEIRRVKLQTDLHNTDTHLSPELFVARAISKGILFAAVSLPLVLISPFFLIVTAWLGWRNYKTEINKLEKQIKERRMSIERELPQFAGTIRQCLSSTRSIIVILESYRKVCGSTLKGEIDKTLNDIKIGNDEVALKAFESRINSPKVSELVRGLVAVIRGEDQRMYFEMLTHEYIKAENEVVRRELLERPLKLKPYVYGMLASMIAMFLTAVIVYMLNHNMFA